MTVHHTLDPRETLVQLAMDVAFEEAFRSVRIDWTGVRDEVFDDVACVCDVGGGEVAGHEEIGYVVGIADLEVVLAGVSGQCGFGNGGLREKLSSAGLIRLIGMEKETDAHMAVSIENTIVV